MAKRMVGMHDSNRQAVAPSHVNPEFHNRKLKNNEGNKLTHKLPSRLLAATRLLIVIVLSNIARTLTIWIFFHCLTNNFV